MCIGIFKKEKFSIVNNPADAEIIVINTCGFIESAKEEAINTILEMAEYKDSGKCKYLIVMGCLVKRYKEELIKAIPEVDLFLSIEEYDNIWDKISEVIKSKKSEEVLDYMNRVITTGNKQAYLKIAEGCDNKCTYCAIPMIRGPFVSRKMEDVLEEAESLAKKGYEEIIVIAQDTTKYGIDIYGESKLAELLQRLSEIPEIKWIRFLYTYPEGITDELIKVVKENDKICNYFDIPIQHYSDSVLKMMNRKTTGEKIEKLIEKIRENIPDAIIRTSLIVGFPKESEEDFNKLYEFVKRVNFDKLGVFKYSKEDGTPAAKIPEQINGNTKRSRHNKIMKLQEKISRTKLESKIGNIYEAIIESETSDGKYYVGRTYMDVPDMDGVVFIQKTKENLKDKFVKCKIINILDYDLIAELI